MIDWADIQVFLLVLRSGRIAPAAQRMGLSEATVRDRLEAIEARGCGPLFVRLGQTLTPTAAALKLGEAAGRMATAAPAGPAGESSSSSGLAGEVRITTTELLATNVLMPVFAELRRRYPALVLRLGVTTANEDLSRAAADVAVRIYRPSQQSLVIRSAPAGVLGLFAHRDYLAAAGRPADLADLARFDLIGAARETATLKILAEMGLVVSPADFVCRIESQAGQAQAIAAGLGIGVAFLPSAARDPNLVRVLPEVELARQVFVCVHQDMETTPRVRAVRDAIVDFLRSRAWAFPGADLDDEAA